MKKLLSVCISLFVLTACGDNYSSITVKEFFNDKTIQEQEKITEWLREQLSPSQAMVFGSLAMSCSKQARDVLGNKHSSIFPEKCNQTLGDLIKNK